MKALALVLGTDAFSAAGIGLPPVGKWLSVARERAQLRELTDAQLADIGLTRADAHAEAARPFWDIRVRR